MSMSEASFASLGPTLLARKGGAKPAMRPQLTPLPDNISQLANLAEEQLEDLGWNDMGDGEPPEQSIEESPSDDAGVSDTSAFAPSPLLARKSGALHEEAEHVYDAAEEHPESDDENASDASHPIIDPLGGAEIVPITGRTKNPAIAFAANEDGDSDADASADESAGSPLLRKKSAAFEPAPPSKSKQPKGNTARRAAFTLRLDPERHLKLRLAATLQGVSAQSLVTEALDALLGDMEELGPLVDRMNRH